MNIDFKSGKIEWNTLDEVDFSKPAIDQELSEDIFWVQFNNFHLDLGWYQDTFVLYVLKEDDKGVPNWERPLEKSFIQNIDDLEYKVQSTINYWINKEI
jgi:hypothetical protein